MDAVVVGRLAERRKLRAWLDEAIAGQPRAVLITGPKGSGKSTMLDILHRDASSRGAVVVDASCAGASVLLGPAINTILRTVVAHAPAVPAALRRDLAPLLGTAEPSDAERTERLLGRAVVAVEGLLTLAWDPGLVVLLDDLDAADEVTAAVANHISTVLSADRPGPPARVLVVAAATATQGDDVASPRGGRTVELGAMDETDVADLVQSHTGLRAGGRLVRELVDVSSGSPGHVLRLVDAAQRAGEISRAGETLDLVAPRLTAAVEPVPSQLTDLPAPTRDLLIDAAVLGQAGPLEILDRLGEEDPVALLAPAVSAGLVAVDGRDFRFTSPSICVSIRSSVAEADLARRNERIHHVLRDLPGHLLAAAHHALAAGSEVGDLAMFEQAAKEAEVGARWVEAAAFHDAVVDRSPGSARAAFRAGEAHYRAHDQTNAARRWEESRRLAIDDGDVALEGSAIAALMQTPETEAANIARAPAAASPAGSPFNLARRYSERTDAPARSRALVSSMLAMEHFGRNELGDARRAALAAVDAAAGTDDPEVLARVAFSSGMTSLGVLDLDDAAHHFATVTEHGERADDPIWVSRGHSRTALVAVARGALDDAAFHAETAATVQRRDGYWGEHSLSTALLANVAVAQGRFADVEWAAIDSVRSLQRSAYGFTPAIVYPVLASARALRGDANGAERAIEQFAATGARGTWRLRQLVACFDGAEDAVRAQLDARPWSVPDGDDLNLLNCAIATLGAEIALLTGDAMGLGTAVRPSIQTLLDAGLSFTPGWPAFLPRIAAELDQLLGGTASAGSASLRDVEAKATSIGAEAEAARCGLARDPAAPAVAERLDRLGMLPFLGRIAARDGERVGLRYVMFNDLVGSTRLNVRAGDDAYLALLSELEEIVRGRLRIHRGVEFKHSGDGIMAWFTAAADAIECAFQINEDLETANVSHPEFPLVLRTGIAAGDVILRRGDLFGLSVVEASRICDIAAGGQILVSDRIAREADRGAGVAFTPLGPIELKGLPDAVPVWEANSGE